jgi:hypothetical protein
VRFSDGSSGIHDFTEIFSEPGPTVELLRDRKFFKRVFVSLGVLTWPNGYGLDANPLHGEMKTAGELIATAAA